MIPDPLIADIGQVRLDELAGKHAHGSLLRTPKRWTRLVEVITVVVPILYFAPKILLSDSESASAIIAIEVLLSVTLLAAAVSRKFLGWDETVLGHRNCMAQNTRAANQALELLQDGNATEDAARWFLRLTKEPNASEAQLLEGVKPDLRKEAYREALKEFMPSSADSARCLKCNASAWDYKPGPCQTCGGTPDKAGRRNAP